MVDGPDVMMGERFRLSLFLIYTQVALKVTVELGLEFPPLD